VAVIVPLVVLTASLPKERLAGERLTEGLEVPVPERLTDWGLLLALSIKVTAAVIDPALIGANWTLIVHVAPTATLVPQLLVWIY
jgi:hypothetical protein